MLVAPEIIKGMGLPEARLVSRDLNILDNEHPIKYFSTYLLGALERNEGISRIIQDTGR